ncbi:MAG: ABC transporter permease, partial [Mycobacteriales bacterium]
MTQQADPEQGGRTPSAVAQPPAPTAESGRATRWWAALQNVVLGGALVLTLAIFGSLNSTYLSAANLKTIAQTVAVVGALAVVQTVVIICGALDISVGSQAGIASVVSAMAFTATGGSALAGVAAALGVGVLAGLVNGLIIVFGRVNAVIATLGTLAAYKGVALVISNGRAQGFVLNDGFFIFVARGNILGIPTMVWIFLAIAAAIHVLLSYTDIGRNIYAIGGNDKAARLAGIDINKYLIAVYILSGIVAAVAGIMLTAYTGSGQPVSGSQGLELQSITAAALGGAALAGGRGGIGGTVLAVLLLGALVNGLDVVGVNSFWQNVAQGALLIVSVIV